MAWTSVAAAGLLAGCSGGGGGAAPASSDGGAGDGSADSEGGGDTGGDGGSGQVQAMGAVVGDLAAVGPVRVAVTDVERLARAPLFGTVEVSASEGNEFLAADVAFVNATERYTALVVDLFAVAVGDRVYTPSEPLVDLLSPEFGGRALAPGELWRTRLHFEVPAGASDARLRAVLRTRTLPTETFERLVPLQVDLQSRSEAPAALAQSFGDHLTTGEPVVHEGVELTLRDALVPVEVPGRTPPEGHEFAALDLAVTNGGDLPNPILVTLGGMGGLALGDGDGNVYASEVRFTGEVAGGRRYDVSNGIAPGESAAGVAVTAVPVGVTPLYVTWTPPAVYWRAGLAVDRNRYVWQVR